MQDDCNLRPLPQKNQFCQGRKCLSKSKMIPNNETSAKKKYFTINFIHLIHKFTIVSSFTIHCHCPHLHSQCLHLPDTHSWHSYPLHCHSTIYHHQSHPLKWTCSTSLEPFTVTSSVMCCHAVMTHID